MGPIKCMSAGDGAVGPAAQLSFQFEFWAGSGQCLCVCHMAVIVYAGTQLCRLHEIPPPPRSPPPGFVFPKRGESSFEHSSLWIVLSLIHAVPIPPVFLPRLRDIPKELEGREGGFFLFGSGQEGARCFGKARGSNRKRVPATVCLTSLRLLLWLHVPLVLRSLLPYSCHKERTGKPLGIRLD